MEVQSCGSSFVCHFCVVTVVRFYDCSKDKLCCYCPVPCLLLIVSLWPVLLFICTFHLHIQPFFFFYLNLNRGPFLRSSFMLAFMSPCPLKTPFGLLFPHFLPSSLSLSYAESLKCTFQTLLFDWDFAHCNTHGEHSLF